MCQRGNFARIMTPSNEPIHIIWCGEKFLNLKGPVAMKVQMLLLEALAYLLLHGGDGRFWQPDWLR